MKTLKKAEQRNVLLDQDYYTLSQINELLLKKEAWYLNEKNEIVSDLLEWGDAEQLRINLDQGDRLEVVLDEYGYYRNVLIKENGNKYWINL